MDGGTNTRGLPYFSEDHPTFGRVVRSNAAFDYGEIICRFDGQFTSEVSQHSLQVAPGRHLVDVAFAGLLTHSCNPNVLLRMSEQEAWALAPIAPGDLLTIDYAQTEEYLYRAFACGCGSSGCRGMIHSSKESVNALNEPAYLNIEQNGARYYGQHMMVSAYGCHPRLLNIEFMSSFLRELADRIDMVRFGPPHVYRFGSGVECGLSGFQLIETSQVSFHSNDAARDLYLDVFSCKPFSQQLVLDYVAGTLFPRKMRQQTFWRD